MGGGGSAGDPEDCVEARGPVTSGGVWLLILGVVTRVALEGCLTRCPLISGIPCGEVDRGVLVHDRLFLIGDPYSSRSLDPWAATRVELEGSPICCRVSSGGPCEVLDRGV